MTFFLVGLLNLDHTKNNGSDDGSFVEYRFQRIDVDLFPSC